MRYNAQTVKMRHLMSEEKFKNKLVAVLNKNIETGKVMNALAHMSIGIGAAIGNKELRLTNYQDADGGSHLYISELPFIILSSNSNKIRILRQEALINNIIFNDFTDTMTIGTYKEQIERTLEVSDKNLIYYGIILFGDWDKVTELTKKFSLWR